jgi:DNA repair exonuclease SbcCD ATPase subunit
VAEELGKIEDPARRAALQVDLLGKSGEELRRTFAEIPGAATDLEKFGAAISEEDRARIEALGPAFDGFGVALRGLGQSVLTPFAGIVAGLTETLSGIINVVTAVAQAFGSVLGPVLNEFGSLFGGIGDGINAVVGYFRGFFGSVEEATTRTAALQNAVQQSTKFDDAPARRYAESVKQISVNLDSAFKEAVRFGNEGLKAAGTYSSTVAKLREEFDRGLISENLFKFEIEKANEAYENQIDLVRRVAEEAERKAQAEVDAVDRIIQANERANRIQDEFGGNEDRLRASENLLLIYKEYERVEAQLAQARSDGDEAAIEALQRRVELLSDAATEERDVASGAAERRKAEEDAAAKRIERDRQVADKRLQAEKEVERQIASERDRVNQFVNDQLALAQFGGSQQRLQASQRVAEIEQEIARVQTEIDAARNAGNQSAVNAGVSRIAQLDQVAAKERDIASGRAETEAKIQEQRQQALQAEQQAAQQAAQERQQFIQQQQQQAQQFAQQQQKVYEEQAKAAAAEAERQAKRINSLNSVGQQTIGGGDIRTSEGARQFLQAASGAFDPNLAELRAQSKLLRQIVLNSGALQYLEQGIGSTVTFLRGGA